MTEEVTRSRRVALEALRAVDGGELLDRALARAASALEPREHAWVQELVYGTVRLRGRLDFVLGAFVRSGLESLQPVVLDVLRLGAYQLLEMGGVPAYAAISQSVELVRAAGAARASGLVNGVLQSVRRGSGSVVYPPLEIDPSGYLTTWGSHPRWLVERWLARWGTEDTLRLVEANNKRPELFLTPAGLSAEAALRTLEEAGIAAEPVEGFPTSVRIVPPHGPVEALAAVPAVIQDPAAAMVVRYCDFPSSATILDLSAAPGGKSTTLAADASFLVAADLSFGRLRRVRSNLERTGVRERTALVTADARRPPFRPAEAVLLDAPCTGTGTLRRHPDGRWRLTEADLQSLARLQHELLDGAASVVAPGGLLVYATCSLEPEENEMQVAAFLERHPEFHTEAPGATIDGTMVRNGHLAIVPHLHGVDGAFAARLRRAA